jgi:hypothetical protein
MMDTTPLRDAYRALLDAAATVADSGDTSPVPPAGEWNAEQILAHVSLVSAATIAAVSCVAAGANTTYDNRTALDTWTIERVIALAGCNTGLRDRIRLQGDALCALGGPVSSGACILACRPGSRSATVGQSWRAGRGIAWHADSPETFGIVT